MISRKTDPIQRLPKLKRALEHGITFRPVTLSDMPFLRKVYRSTREEELDRTGWPEEARAAFIDMQFRAQHEYYRQHYRPALWLLTEYRGAPCGRLYLAYRSRDLRIIDISLLPETRGRGIGHAILSDLTEDAATMQNTVSIHVEKQNPAMSLYRRLGFKTLEDKGVYDLLVWSPDRSSCSDVS